jgi:hypothetical protein
MEIKSVKNRLSTKKIEMVEECSCYARSHMLRRLFWEFGCFDKIYQALQDYSRGRISAKFFRQRGESREKWER